MPNSSGSDSSFFPGYFKGSGFSFYAYLQAAYVFVCLLLSNYSWSVGLYSLIVGVVIDQLVGRCCLVADNKLGDKADGEVVSVLSEMIKKAIEGSADNRKQNNEDSPFKRLSVEVPENNNLPPAKTPVVKGGRKLSLQYTPTNSNQKIEIVPIFTVVNTEKINLLKKDVLDIKKNLFNDNANGGKKNFTVEMSDITFSPIETSNNINNSGLFLANIDQDQDQDPYLDSDSDSGTDSPLVLKLIWVDESGGTEKFGGSIKNGIVYDENNTVLVDDDGRLIILDMDEVNKSVEDIQSPESPTALNNSC